MTVASAVIVYAFVAGDYSIKYVQRYSDGRCRSSTRSRRTGAGSTARSCSGSSCSSSSAAIAVYVNRERHRELIPYVVAVIAVT
jgi:cytochrome c-type biogenesis protein CcmF